jgi:hypothetical protein
MFGAECAYGIGVPRHQRRRHQIGEMRHQQLFRRIAHGSRVIHHQRVRMDMFQYMCRGDVGHVERRILAHQHHVHGAEIDARRRTGSEMVAALPAYRHRPCDGGYAFGDAPVRRRPPFLQREMPHFVMPQRVPAKLRLEHQREAAIAIDIDRVERVHLDRDVQFIRHGLP